MLATPAAGVGGARSLLPGSQWLEPRWTGAEGAARGREAAVGMERLRRAGEQVAESVLTRRLERELEALMAHERARSGAARRSEAALLERELEGLLAAEWRRVSAAKEEEDDDEDSEAGVDWLRSLGLVQDRPSEFHQQVLAANPWLRKYPLLAPGGPTAEVAACIALTFQGSFCWSTCFEPDFIAALIYEGYLPMAEATPHGPAPHILLPKMHQDRCVLALADLHVKRSVRKRAKRFRVSSGACFDRVLQGCLAQHGENWLYPPIVELFQRLFCSGGAGGVRMHSFEVWDEDGALVAGEVGYSVGGCYTSASGFSTVDNAGSVQCVATALLLEQAGASFWDLGMALPYKLAMGAHCVPRPDFLALLHRSREGPPLPHSFAPDALPCQALVGAWRAARGDAPPPPAETVASTTASTAAAPGPSGRAGGASGRGRSPRASSVSPSPSLSALPPARGKGARKGARSPRRGDSHGGLDSSLSLSDLSAAHEDLSAAQESKPSRRGRRGRARRAAALPECSSSASPARERAG